MTWPKVWYERWGWYSRIDIIYGKALLMALPRSFSTCLFSFLTNISKSSRHPCPFMDRHYNRHYGLKPNSPNFASNNSGRSLRGWRMEDQKPKIELSRVESSLKKFRVTVHLDLTGTRHIYTLELRKRLWQSGVSWLWTRHNVPDQAVQVVYSAL